MATINQNWYNKNENRRYPLVDGISTDVLQIPNNLIVDCNLWVPEAAGEKVWVSSIMVTNNLVTLTLQAVTPPLNTFTPVASISLVKPLVMYRPYIVTALYPGVSGWFSFGSGINNNTSRLFSDYTQTEILPKKVQRYTGNILEGVKKENNQLVLTGLIQLRSAGDITFRTSTRNVGLLGNRTTILIGLNRDTDQETTHEKYLSSQSARPENGNCPKQPILFINDVAPDCNGNIEIEFPPEIIDDRHPEDNGIIIDYPLGFIDVCTNTSTITPRDEKLCDVPVDTEEVTVVVPPIPPPPPLPPDYPNGMPFVDTVCEDFSTELTEFLEPKPQPPWVYNEYVLNDPENGKPRIQLNVLLRNSTWRLIRNFTYGDHRNRVMQIETQFGTSLHTSSPAGLGTWDNIGLIYNYVSQTSYNFVSLIWLGFNGPGVPLANDPRNAMLVIGHKTTNTKHLTPYGYDFQNPPVPTVRGLSDGHFIDTFKFIQINPNNPYLIQLTTTEGPAGTTTALAEILELDEFDTYVPLDSIVNVSSTINVAALSRVGVLAVSASDVFVSFLAIDPEPGCEPLVLET